MTPFVDSQRPLNSSSTPRVGPTVAATESRRFQDFSSLMRAKQEASRLVHPSPAGGHVLGQLAVGTGGAGTATNPLGPRADEVASPDDGEEFQRDGRDAQGRKPAAEGLALWVDPLQRVLAQPTAGLCESLPASSLPNPASAMEELLRGVRRFAWGGDRQRSVAYIEFGAGELSGAALTLEAHGGAISLVLDLPAGVSSAGWAERLARRLAQRGLEVQSVEVH